MGKNDPPILRFFLFREDVFESCLMRGCAMDKKSTEWSAGPRKG